MEFAWNVDDIKEIIATFDAKKIPILGGDVYKMVDDNVCYTYDSWFINKSSENDFYRISHEKAISYISNYEERNEGQFFYTIIF